MKPFRGFLVVAFLLLASQASMAAFVARDLSASGDGLLTLDTATNLEWLDVPASVQRSYNDVVSNLGPGGDFAGFRYATLDEMRALLDHANITVRDGTTVGELGQVQQFLSFFGGTWFEAGGFPGPGVRGVFGLSDDQGGHFMTDVGVITAANLTIAVIGSQCDFDCFSFRDSRINPAIGSFLVRQAPNAVPLPSGGWLLAGGVISLVSARKRFSLKR